MLPTKFLLAAIAVALLYSFTNFQPPKNKVSVWLTKADSSVLLQQQKTNLHFTNSANASLTVIAVDAAQKYQTIDGFGFTLTGGSAALIKRLNTNNKKQLLQELFGNKTNAIKISYLRISIGASDLNSEVYSYNDLPAGETDTGLLKFNLSKDTADVLPLLKQIVAINPGIKIMGSPWSAPAWMKSNGNSMGGSLLPRYYGVYAAYFVKYLQAMQANGINLDAITIQNEPQYGGNNPSMVMSPAEQAAFIKNFLGPAFAKAGIKTKIIIWDHNCDNPEYPISILNDAGARQYINGTAFHLYAGSVNALSTVHNQHPDKSIYFTEQWTGSKGCFEDDLKWHTQNVIIGALRNWSRTALEWNLANDATFNPHTPGGCTECKGALTITNTVTRNVAYYIIAHAAKFIPPGAVRIASTEANNLYTVACLTPNGTKVLLVLNSNSSAANFAIQFNNQTTVAQQPANSVATYTWQ
jgi:glucosylceramidase